MPDGVSILPLHTDLPVIVRSVLVRRGVRRIATRRGTGVETSERAANLTAHIRKQGDVRFETTK